MGNRITRTVLFAAFALLSMSALGAGAARFGTLRNADWVVTNAWQAVSNKTHDLILEIGQEGSLPPDWLNVSNAAMNAVQSLQPVYDYTDNTLISFSSTGSVFRSLSYGTPNYWTDATGCVWEVVISSRWNIVYKEPEQGSQYLIYIKPSGLGNGKYWEPYSGEYSAGDAKGDEDSTVLVWEGDAITDFTATRTLGLNTNIVGRVALTNDIPHPMTVVAPSTNATLGTAADARATGIALYTGFTEWVYTGGVSTDVVYSVQLESPIPNLFLANLLANGSFISFEYISGFDVTEIEFTNTLETAITATRHRIRPTKTSQLTNDGSNGVPFAVETMVNSKQDALPYPTNAIPFHVISGAPSLAGQTFDFSHNYDIIRATAAIAEVLGATVTNNPTAEGN